MRTRRGASRSRVYDPRQRWIAASIERERAPRWVVWWGVASRRAVPTWQGAAVAIVEGRDAGELWAAMNAVERRALGSADKIRGGGGGFGRDVR